MGILQPDANEPAFASKPRRSLTLFDCICIIVGTIIGSGIFKTAPDVASYAGSFGWMIAFWMFGGILSLVGALCFAELSTMHREHVGGDYIYLKKAYGRPLAFMFAWASFWIIRPGNICAMGMAFAIYFDQIIPIDSWTPFEGGNLIPYALLSVGLLSGMNLIGLRTGKGTQNLLTSAKVIGIGGIVFVAFLFATPPESQSITTKAPSLGSAWMAMVFVMFTFGGWNDIALVAGEVKDPEKNLFRSLVLGTVLVTLIYVVVNLAFVYALGFSGMSQSEAVSTETVKSTFGGATWLGRSSGALISALVCVSCLGAINGMILTGPRIYYSAGRDFPPLAFLAQWSKQRDVPWQATLLQAMITFCLILLCLGYKDAFQVIVAVVSPYFWGFLGLTAISLIVFRLGGGSKGGSKVAEGQKGFRVPLFPLEPIILLAVCIGLVGASINWVIFNKYWTASLVVAGIRAAGVVVGIVLSRKYPAEIEE